MKPKTPPQAAASALARQGARGQATRGTLGDRQLGSGLGGVRESVAGALVLLSLRSES